MLSADTSGLYLLVYVAFDCVDREIANITTHQMNHYGQICKYVHINQHHCMVVADRLLAYT